jgi:glutamate synthase (ferredoxin)
MMRACHLNTCPVGVATQDPVLREKFMGKPEHVVNFMKFVAEEVRELMAELGFRKFEELIGRTDYLRRRELTHWKTKNVDLSEVLYRPEPFSTSSEPCLAEPEQSFDDDLLKICEPALVNGNAVKAELPIRNIHRSVGTSLGSEVTRQYGPAGLPDDTIQLTFQGSAGQSFGAFVPRGITLNLEGDANDYLGKGLCGGKLVVQPPHDSVFVPEMNVIAGNVAFYGATSGEAYINGTVGERFCVRNSGANVVVESVGDHGCEYMTGGKVVVLGSVGRNFAAGMSGGFAYLVDEHNIMRHRLNLEMVGVTKLTHADEIEGVKDMIFRHAEYTGSNRAAAILLAWDEILPNIVRVLPHDYRRVLEAQGEAHVLERAAGC